MPDTGRAEARLLAMSPVTRDDVLEVRKWIGAAWTQEQAAWTGLLGPSGADELFLSSDWLTEWWQFFCNSWTCSLHVLGVYRGGTLIGFAPFYRRVSMRAGLIPVRSLQLIGVSWRDSTAPISEYLDVIAKREDAQTVRLSCLRALIQEDWEELVIGCTAAGEHWLDVLASIRLGNRFYVRQVDQTVAYQADLSEGFSAYLRRLGQSTRRALWNLRRRLLDHGPVGLEAVTADQIRGGFEDLNRMHQLRWKKPAFVGKRLSFHTTLASRMMSRGELVMSRLRVGGRVVSVLYDIRKAAHQYNIKMGFDPSFSSKLSLGLLHLGYAMEAAASEGVTTYDFLAGPGQSSDYKRHLSQSRRYLSSIQVVRGRVLPRLYRWHDRAP
jgi:CelD/BcsL family acetyltransferase involved in cellulose biosynthesis